MSLAAMVRRSPGAIVGQPARSTHGRQSGRGEVVFYWWHLVEGRDGRLQPDSLRAVGATVP